MSGSSQNDVPPSSNEATSSSNEAQSSTKGVPSSTKDGPSSTKNDPSSTKDEPSSSNEEVVSLGEFLQEIEDLEEASRAVLGGSDDKICTYNQGYVKRQALYACLTCSPDVPVGFCLACSYKCHEDHQLVELYTKRNFRCDCPTERLPGKTCFLESTKTTLTGKFKQNQDNKYNHNFTGAYCTCKRPYPDLDNEDRNDNGMLQCCICEDWYHSDHLNLDEKSYNKEFENFEMICNDCMQKSDFLKDYTGYALKAFDEDTTEDEEKINADLVASDTDVLSKKQENEPSSSDEAGPSAAKMQKLDNESSCQRPQIKTDYEKGATFWPTNWRTLLCTCEKCNIVYFKENVEFLLDSEDTTEYYEKKSKTKLSSETSQQTILAELSNSGLNHVQKINAMMGINHLKEKLKEFLDSFVVNDKIITEADIKNFFETIKKEKSQSESIPQYFCR